MSDCLPCAAIREALNSCGPWYDCYNHLVGPCPIGDPLCSQPGGGTTKPPPAAAGGSQSKGGQPGFIFPPPPTGFFSVSCAPCEDGHIPSLPDCDCSISSQEACGCGDTYCLCQFNACNAGCGPHALCTVDCAIQANICMQNPPQCPTPQSSGPPRTIWVPGPPPCMSPEHDAPCADGECWDQLTGCCAACGSTVILGPPSLGYGETGWSDVSRQLASPSLGL